MTYVNRRKLLMTAASAAATLTAPSIVRAEDTTGITATEIKIGATSPQSGPVSLLGVIARLHEAYFKMINEKGGIAGRKINFIYYDDGFQPPKTVEKVRQLIESDEVAFLFGCVGTAPMTAVANYTNGRKVPNLFMTLNGDKWGEYQKYPMMMGFATSARTESQIYTKYALQQLPKAKFGILYQNDDFGKDYVAGVRDVLGADFDARAVAVPHEVADPTLDSQLVKLKAAGVDVLISGTTAKFVAQSLKKVSELDWKPTHFIANGAISVKDVINPVGGDRVVGILSSATQKDPSDPMWDNDPGMMEYRAFMKNYLPQRSAENTQDLYAYTVVLAIMQVLKQCGTNLSRENIMRQAENLKDVELATLLPGIKVNTSPTNHRPIKQMQLQRWDGTVWKRFGPIIEGSDT